MSDGNETNLANLARPSTTSSAINVGLSVLLVYHAPSKKKATAISTPQSRRISKRRISFMVSRAVGTGGIGMFSSRGYVVSTQSTPPPNRAARRSGRPCTPAGTGRRRFGHHGI